MRLASSLLIISLAWISLSAQDTQQKAAQGEKAATPEQATTPAAVKTNDKTTADKNNAKQTNVTVTGATQKADAPAARQKESAQTASEKSELSVARAAIALNIKDLEPENAGDTFPPEVKRLYCFTHIKGSSGAAEIQHRWYWNDDLMGIVNLPIKSPNYRTYSAKTIPEGMTGEWRVAVVDSKNEEILKMLKVQIK